MIFSLARLKGMFASVTVPAAFGSAACGLVAFGLVAGFGVGPQSAHAQDAQANDAWVKVCNKDPNSDSTVCLTTQEIRAQNGQFLASVAVREFSNRDEKALIIAVPTGMLLQPGLAVRVDQNEQKVVKYGVCFANACYAELPAEGGLISELKRGNQLTLTTMNQQAKPVAFPLTLIGFTKVYDGAPIDPQELQVKQQQLREELQRKAEEARQRLIEQQQQATEGN